MTTAAPVVDFIGLTPVGNFFVPDSNQTQKLGTMITVIDPYFGGMDLLYCSFPASTALAVGTPVIWNVAYSATAVPNTANLGQSLGAVLNAVPSVAAVQYGWVVVKGRFPVLSNASVAADAAIGIAAAGKLGANTAGKQVLNSHVVAAATATVAKANTVTQSGSNIIKVSNADGWFVGLPLSGTGIAASTVITAIDPNNSTVTMNNNATASGAVTVTGTYNDAATNYWNTVYLGNAFGQGAIT